MNASLPSVTLGSRNVNYVSRTPLIRVPIIVEKLDSRILPGGAGRAAGARVLEVDPWLPPPWHTQVGRQPPKGQGRRGLK